MSSGPHLTVDDVPLTRPYFAYGSNMDDTQMHARCRGAQCAGRAVLEGYRFLIMSRGYATIVPGKGSQVYGVLWLLTEEHERSLDYYEGVPAGHYYKEEVVVTPSDAAPIKALVYIARDTQPGTPRPGYLERIVSGADAHGLPDGYVSELRAWSGGAALPA